MDINTQKFWDVFFVFKMLGKHWFEPFFTMLKECILWNLNGIRIFFIPVPNTNTMDFFYSVYVILDVSCELFNQCTPTGLE